MKYIVLFFLILYMAHAGENCEDTLFSFDISKKSSSVKTIDIIENIAHKCKFSVKIKDNEAKKILENELFLVHIKDYTLDDIFDFLFTQNNMFYKYDENKNVLTISYLNTRSFVIDYINLSEHTTDSKKTISIGASSTIDDDDDDSSSSSESSNGNSDTTTIVSKSTFKFWDKLSGEIDVILSRDGDKRKIQSKSIINREAGVITITGTKNQIERISNYLEKIKNRLHKQVILETKLYEVTYDNKESTGINWSKFELSLKGGLPAGSWIDAGDIGASGSGHFSYNFSIDGLLKFLNTYGHVNILSAPKILTLNNQPAVINVGQQINYKYESGSLNTANNTQSTSNTYEINSVFIGLTLNVVPEITDDGYVILRVNPVVSERLDYDDEISEGVRSMPPDIRIKQLSAIVKAKSGNNVVVGGLISTKRENKENSVPLLGSIPILGYAFKNIEETTTKSELVIVITPKIINYDNFPSIENVENLLDGSLDE